mgnify:CR=1 FL=1
MPLWGRNDQAVTANSTTTRESSNGAPIGTYALVKGDQINRAGSANAHFGNTSPGSRAATDVNMFNNTTMNAFMTGKAVGVFGVSATEESNGAGQLGTTFVTFAGSGYPANAAVTITYVGPGSGATINAHSNSSGRIDALNIQANGSAMIDNPTLTIAAPAPVYFTGNSTGVTVGNSTNTGWITLGTTNTALWANGDQATYVANSGNTVIGGLTSGTAYYVYLQNTSTVWLSATPGGAFINLSSVGTLAQAGHSLTGQTATGVATVSANGSTGITHAGWVLRTEGSGGRAGRVFFETLVAMGSLGAQSAPYGTPAIANNASTDDQILPGV